jgi:UDP-glucose 4-epimerase
VTGERRDVLVTGAAGRIGSYFAEQSHTRYRLRLMVEPGQDAASLESWGEVVSADLLDLERMKAVCEGIDTVVHLAGDPNPEATWHSLLDANIIGTYHAFVAARAAGCRRVVYASSIHAVSGYPADLQVKANEPVNPGDLYGVSKCFGEALGRYMAEHENISIIALRIGAFQPLESIQSEGGVALLDSFVSRRDLTQLIQRCIDVEHLDFAILQALSDNRFKRLDISDARRLVGYDPQDDAFEGNPDARSLHFRESIPSHSAQDSGQESGLREEL